MGAQRRGQCRGRRCSYRGRDRTISREGAARARLLLHDGLGGGAVGFQIEAAQAGDSVAVRARGVAPRLVPFLPEFAVDVNATAFDEDAVLP